ncbi:MAG: hypothetical protein HWD86_00345 [Kangiellaceae bacterium]|nr:hypothetical protein [Kangiellaceae bacterium]
MQYKWLIKIVLLGLILVLFVTSTKASNTEANTQYISKEEIINDFEELYQRLQKAHYDLYAHRSKEEFDEHFIKLKHSINAQMTLSEVTVLFQTFASFANIAHTKIDLPTQDYVNYRQSDGKAFPLFVKVIDGKVYVVENYSDAKDISAGDQIVALNKQCMRSLLKDLRKYISADTDTMYFGFLELQFPMLLWFEHGAQEQYEVTIKGENGQKDIMLATIGYDDLIHKMEQRKGLLELGFERVTTVTKQIGYLRPGPFFNTDQNAEDVWDHTSFKSFIDDAFETFSVQKVKALLIDLRNNPGGTNSFSDYMIQKFANKDFKFASDFKVKVSSEFIAANENRLKESVVTETSERYQASYAGLAEGDIFDFNLALNKASSERFEKPVYILVNRHSYSNAVTTAALAQDYDFATIMGEKTNDLATTYGAMEAFKLSKTKIAVSFPKAHIIRPNGEKKAHGVTPDIIIETPLVEYVEDSVLQRALLEIEKRF